MDVLGVEDWPLLKKLRNPLRLDAATRCLLSGLIKFRNEAGLHGFIECENGSSSTKGQMQNPWDGSRRKHSSKIITLYLTSEPVAQIEAEQNGTRVKLPDCTFSEEAIHQVLNEARRTRPAKKKEG